MAEITYTPKIVSKRIELTKTQVTGLSGTKFQLLPPDGPVITNARIRSLRTLIPGSVYINSGINGVTFTYDPACQIIIGWGGAADTVSSIIDFQIYSVPGPIFNGPGQQRYEMPKSTNTQRFMSDNAVPGLTFRNGLFLVSDGLISSSTGGNPFGLSIHFSYIDNGFTTIP